MFFDEVSCLQGCRIGHNGEALMGSGGTRQKQRDGMEKEEATAFIRLVLEVTKNDPNPRFRP